MSEVEGAFLLCLRNLASEFSVLSEWINNDPLTITHDLILLKSSQGEIDYRERPPDRRKEFRRRMMKSELVSPVSASGICAKTLRDTFSMLIRAT